MGRRAPIFQRGYSWTSVPIPAMNMAFCTSMAFWSSLSPATLATIKIGAILATNIASTCCTPKGTAFETGTRPFSLKILLTLAVTFSFSFISFLLVIFQ